jgi:8-oxo-dGTP pyrophosphatase MutT (NUDIX family)/ribosomal protein S18 acetylase RimI-like enzyme
MGSDEVQREALRRFLTDHRPIDEQERASLATFIEQLDRLDRPFAEDGGPIHVTSSAVVVGARGIILHKHKRLGIWIQPGGHIDEGEEPADAALREVLEETGLATTHFAGIPTIVHVDVHAAPKGHTHLDLRYLLRGPDAYPQPPEGESPDVAWLSFDDALAMADVGLAGMLAALTEPCTLRAGTSGDAAAIAECYLDSFNQGLPGIVRPHTDDAVRAWVREVMLPSMSVTVAAHPLGFVTGFCATTPGWITELYVEPAWQARGVGGQLLLQAMGQQPNGLELWAFQQNTRAQRFYERHGFIAIERTDGSGNEERAPDVRYRWSGVADWDPA